MTWRDDLPPEDKAELAWREARIKAREDRCAEDTAEDREAIKRLKNRQDARNRYAMRRAKGGGDGWTS